MMTNNSPPVFGIGLVEVNLEEDKIGHIWFVRYGPHTICNSPPFITEDDCISAARAFIYNFHSNNVRFNFIDEKIPIREKIGNQIEKDCNDIIRKVRYNLEKGEEFSPVLTKKGFTLLRRNPEEPPPIPEEVK